VAFIASQVALQRGFEALQSVAAQQKTYLGIWNTKLAGNITALDGLEIVSSINQATTLMDQYAALPGLAAYVQTQFGSPGYDVAAEYTAMRAALIAVRNWLTSNIPPNAITITNGAQVGAVYTPAQTAGLKTLVTAAAATIA
jgi:hypothetical protein